MYDLLFYIAYCLSVLGNVKAELNSEVCTSSIQTKLMPFEYKKEKLVSRIISTSYEPG